jgi:hypothetical protein
VIDAKAPDLVPTAVCVDRCASFNFQVLLKPYDGAVLELLQLTFRIFEKCFAPS